MVKIKTQIEIAAPPAKVYSVLLDLKKWNEWNPFIEYLSGEVKQGEHLTLRFDKSITFSPLILKMEENKEFRWKGKLACGGLFDGEHYFILSGDDNRTVLDHGENFSGILPPIMPGAMKKTEANFIQLNESLKKRCETGS